MEAERREEQGVVPCRTSSCRTEEGGLASRRCTRFRVFRIVFLACRHAFFFCSTTVRINFFMEESWTVVTGLVPLFLFRFALSACSTSMAGKVSVVTLTWLSCSSGSEETSTSTFSEQQEPEDEHEHEEESCDVQEDVPEEQKEEHVSEKEKAYDEHEQCEGDELERWVLVAMTMELCRRDGRTGEAITRFPICEVGTALAIGSVRVTESLCVSLLDGLDGAASAASSFAIMTEEGGWWRGGGRGGEGGVLEKGNGGMTEHGVVAGDKVLGTPAGSVALLRTGGGAAEQGEDGG